MNSAPRPEVRGKFLFVGDARFHVRGVTYGTFRSGIDGEPVPAREDVEEDFSAMAAHGVNTVRMYTVPPGWVLDAAQARGLRVMVGLPWDQHRAFLDDRGNGRRIVDGVREAVRSVAGHPAMLCYAVGNEIPASIVRWHGARRIERFLKRLARVVREEDPGGLVTYVNYPSTEYLRLPWVDICSFNVFLEERSRLVAYLARLQNLAGERPLVLAEIGLDSRRHGEDGQARALDWQLRATSAAGCAGAVVFAWTDEWHRGGHDIEDWDFGLVTRDRRPKQALAAVQAAFAEAPFEAGTRWPRVSVVVCTHNGAGTLRECLEGLRRLEYPDYETIVVDDGSSDETQDIVRGFGVRLIATERRGLGAARNTGLEVATGEIVAYLDDDAWPDAHWLKYLVTTFGEGAHAAVGGPNLAPAGGGEIAECVRNAPGGPVHVLRTDTEAEHIPGCNLAFRRERLMEVGGFDARFRAAGDDVDICWRIVERGWTIGFSPAAVVWHRRRNSVLAYWRQQWGYGRAEALLERKWPEKYNAIGHIAWGGRLYGPGLTRTLLRRRQIYHGIWGSAPFQSVEESAPSLLTVLPMMPEWYLVVLGLGGVMAMGWLWPRLLMVAPLLVLAAGATVWQAALSAAQATFVTPPPTRWAAFGRYGMTAVLHLLQPLARLMGRVGSGLTILRRRGPRSLVLPVPRSTEVWCENWCAPERKLGWVMGALRQEGAVLVAGSEWDRWDLEVRGGALGAARLLMAVEEHGGGRQLFRFRAWPRFSVEGAVPIAVFTALALGAAFEGHWAAGALLALAAAGFLGRMLLEGAHAMAAVRRAVEGLERGGTETG